MTEPRPTVKDVARSVARLDENASTPDKGSVNINGTSWTRYELRQSVADNLAFVIGSTVRLRKITQRDAALMLAASGASAFTIEQHSRAIAAMLRELADRHGSWSPIV